MQISQFWSNLDILKTHMVSMALVNVQRSRFLTTDTDQYWYVGIGYAQYWIG